MPSRIITGPGGGPAVAGHVLDVSGTHLLAVTADAADWTLAGLTGGTDGHWLLIRNGGMHTLSLAHEDASAPAHARVRTSGGAAVNCAPGHTALLIYDALLARWVLHSVG